MPRIVIVSLRASPLATTASPSRAEPYRFHPRSVHTPFAQLQLYWESFLSHQFDQTDFFDFLAKIHLELPNKTVMREFGRIVQTETDKPYLDQQQILLSEIEDWETTTRIDGIMPFQVPQVQNITSLATRLIRAVVPLGFDMPDPDSLDRIKAEMGLCFLAWLHGRQVRSTYAMAIDLNTQCPRSAMAAKDEICVMGVLPNTRSISIFFSDLKGRNWLTMPEASLEHYEILLARRDANGDLRLHGISWGEG